MHDSLPATEQQVQSLVPAQWDCCSCFPSRLIRDKQVFRQLLDWCFWAVRIQVAHNGCRVGLADSVLQTFGTEALPNFVRGTGYPVCIRATIPVYKKKYGSRPKEKCKKMTYICLWYKCEESSYKHCGRDL